MTDQQWLFSAVPVEQELSGQDALVFWSTRSSDTFSNFFCEEVFRSCMYTTELCISIQRYSYRYRYRVVGAENLCHQAIFMNHAPCAVTPLNPELIQVGHAIG